MRLSGNSRSLVEQPQTTDSASTLLRRMIPLLSLRLSRAGLPCNVTSTEFARDTEERIKFGTVDPLIFKYRNIDRCRGFMRHCKVYASQMMKMEQEISKLTFNMNACQKRNFYYTDDVHEVYWLYLHNFLN